MLSSIIFLYYMHDLDMIATALMMNFLEIIFMIIFYVTSVAL